MVYLFDLQRELATQTHELVLFLSEELSNEGILLYYYTKTYAHMYMCIHVHCTYMYYVHVTVFAYIIGFPRLKSLLCIGGTAVRDQIEVLKR